MATNEERFLEAYHRIMGALPALAHRGKRRLADDQDVADLPNAILNHPVTWYGFNGKTQTAGRKTTSLAAFVGWIDAGLHNLMNGINTVIVGLAGLQAAVEALGKVQGIDPVELAKVIDAAVEKSADKHLGELGTYQLTKVEESK